MKKYARLRQECSEFDNALFNASPDRPSFHEASSSLEFIRSQSRRAPAVLSSSDGSASPPRDSPPAIRLARLQQQPAPAADGPSHSDLAQALQKLASYREGGSRRHSSAPWQQGAANVGQHSRSGSGRWPFHAHDAREHNPDDPSGSGRWQTAETASLSGRWGSVTTTSDQWDDALHQSFRDSLSLSRSGRLEAEPWTIPATITTSLPAHSSGRTLDVEANEPRQFGAANISMRETQGWLASVKRPLQLSKKNNIWEDPNEFNWRAAATNGKSSSSSASASSRKERPMTASQSMRYDRLKTSAFGEEDAYCHQHASHAVMQKAASMREGGAHSDAIMAMARAYSEKHGVPHQQAILECVACGRGLGVILQGNRGNDTSFCHSCRPQGWTVHTKAAPENYKSKRKGMMHFCKKILRMGKKPNKFKA